jgi:hypothetical protein
MGIGLGDVDGDGQFDLFVTNLDGEGHVLYRSEGTGGFREAAVESALRAACLPHTGFGTAMADLENRGCLDLLVANGAVRRPEAARSRKPADLSVPDFWKPYAEPNQILLNDGAGAFREYRSDLDPFTSTVEVSRGLAVGDLNDDGGVDVLVTNVCGPARLYFNAAQRGRWLSVRAVLPDRGGRDDYGAVVTLVAGAKRWTRLIQPGLSYLTSHDPRAHFGLGSVDRVDHLEVLWSDGAREAFPGGEADRQVVLARGGGTAAAR